MATTSIRWALVKECVARFQLHPQAGSVSVLTFPPGDLDIADEMLFMSKATTTTSVPHQRAGRLDRDQFVVIEWSVGVNGRSSVDATMTRYDEIVSIIEDTFADDASLGNFDGVLDAVVDADEATPARSPDGFFVLGTVTTTIHTRLN